MHTKFDLNINEANNRCCTLNGSNSTQLPSTFKFIRKCPHKKKPNKLIAYNQLTLLLNKLIIGKLSLSISLNLFLCYLPKQISTLKFNKISYRYSHVFYIIERKRKGIGYQNLLLMYPTDNRSAMPKAPPLLNKTFHNSLNNSIFSFLSNTPFHMLHHCHLKCLM